MQELKFRNFTPSLLAFIVGIGISAGSSYINIAPFYLPVPLLVIGLFAGFLVLNFIFYPKANTAQIIQLTITGVFINAASFILAIFGAKFLNHAPIMLNSEFILSINPLMPLLSFIFSFLTIISFVKFEEKNVKSKKIEKHEEKQDEKKVEEVKPEVVTFEVREAPAPAKEKETIDFSIRIQENKEKEEAPKSVYEELYPQAEVEAIKAKEPELQEFFFGLNEVETEIKNKIDVREGKPLEENEGFIDFSAAPSINFEENISAEKAPAPASSSKDEEYFDFIPTDIRLIEAPTSKNNESKGKIASIGKLLVNNRDIEGVIESTAAIADNGGEGKTNVVSSASGEHIYEKFTRLKDEFSHIRDIALVDKGGFILASNFEDAMKTHIAGALIAGAYHTLQNYLAQISFKFPQKIFFETENSNNFIIKTDEELLFSIWDKEFKHIDYSLLEGFIENESISEADLIPLIELGQITNFAIADGAGQLINSMNHTEKSEKLAIISSALFENLKVFLMNIQLMKLRRITILNDEEVITIQKFNDEIASFITPVDGLVKVSGEFSKIEEIY